MSDTQWADWLDAALKERGWAQAELVRQSEGHIKADRVSKWLSGKEGPSHKFAIVAANTLGKEHSEALRAAGFTEAADGLERRRTMLDQHLFAKPSQGRLLELLKDVPDSELLRVLHLRAQRRESDVVEPTGAARGNRHAIEKTVRGHAENVSGMSDDQLSDIDLSRSEMDLAASRDGSTVIEQQHTNDEDESQDQED